MLKRDNATVFVNGFWDDYLDGQPWIGVHQAGNFGNSEGFRHKSTAKQPVNRHGQDRFL